MVAVLIALLAGMWAGLLRLGWAWPPLLLTLPANHGPLMIGGFLGALIGLERAIGTGKRWAYAAPVLAGLGTLALFIDGSGQLAPALLTLSSAVLLAVLVTLYRLQPALFTGTLCLGGLSWLIGNALWWAGWSVPAVVLWWAGFLILTIAGERLELSRLLRLSTFAQGSFLAATAILFIGMAASIGATLLTPGATHFGSALHLRALHLSARIAGLGMLALAAWLLHYDIARRRLRAGGQARYIGLCLLSGYVWLAAAGVMALAFGGVRAGPHYDALLHAIFLGFVFSMVFGHAPIILPAVLRLPVAYTPAWYAPLILLHLSLLLRVVGDLLPWWPARLWGGLLNAVVLLLFLGTMAVSALRGRSAATRQPA